MRMLLTSNAGRRKPFYITLLTKVDQGELYKARWQLSSEEIALLILPGSVYSKLRRVGGKGLGRATLLETRTAPGSSGVAGRRNRQSNSGPVSAPFLPLGTKEILLWF